MTATILSACSASVQSAVSPQSDSEHSLIPFPVERTAAGLETLYKQGSETFARSPGALEANFELTLQSSSGTMEYAVYSLGAEPPFTLQRVEPFVHEASTGIWVGLANFQAQRWDLSGPYAGTDLAIQPLVGFEHVSALGKVYCAIVVANGDAVQIEGIEGEFFTL